MKPIVELDRSCVRSVLGPLGLRAIEISSKNGEFLETDFLMGDALNNAQDCNNPAKQMKNNI
jgi:hypothetical protein